MTFCFSFLTALPRHLVMLSKGCFLYLLGDNHYPLSSFWHGFCSLGKLFRSFHTLLVDPDKYENTHISSGLKTKTEIVWHWLVGRIEWHFKIQFSSYDFFCSLLDFMLECISIFFIPLKINTERVCFCPPHSPFTCCTWEKEKQMRKIVTL